jgi:hypothetical protein
MKLIDKYLGEANKTYYHVVLEDGEHNVIVSVYDHPRLGGQQLKAFKDRKEAIQFAIKMKKPREVVMTWKQVGYGARANWLKGGEFTKLVGGK